MHKILIVDDDHDLIEGQKIFLTSKGYEIRTAGSMDEGLEMLKSFTPNLILVDLMMEHYDSGFVFCQKIRNNPELSTVPILMQTSAAKQLGFTLEVYDDKARSWMKVEEILTKPVPLEDLAEKIENYLSR